jgi:hypothetical protein
MVRNTNSACRDLTVSASGSRTSVANIRPRSSLLDLFPESARLDAFLRISSTEEVRDKLTHHSVPNDQELWSAPKHVKLDALADFSQSYLATNESVEFCERLIARCRSCLVAKEFENPEYMRWFYKVRDFFGGREVSLPKKRQSSGESCNTIAGASLTGKTALLQRLRVVMGTPFSLMGAQDAPTLHVVPLVMLKYPDCNTLRGLLSNLRRALLTEVGGADADQTQFPSLAGPNGPDMAISLCILLNVCLVVVDGANARSVSGASMEVVDFLLRLQGYSGAEVVVSGTCAFMYYVAKRGEKSSSLFSGLQLALEPSACPDLDKDGRVNKKKLWVKRNEWYWRLGLFGRDLPMPEALPLWTHRASQGREGWLAQGYEELHIKLINKSELLEPGRLTEDIVADAFARRLQNQSVAIEVVRQSEEENVVEDEADFLDYVDYFPHSFLTLPENRRRLNGQWRLK